MGEESDPQGTELKFDSTTKWYMRKREFVQENSTHQILWDFVIQTDHRISTRRPDLVIINKKNCANLLNSGLAVPADHNVKIKENKEGDKFLDFAKELKNL